MSKKIFTGLLLIVYLLVTPMGGVAWAYEVPQSPSAPTAPEAPTAPGAPGAPDAPASPGAGDSSGDENAVTEATAPTPASEPTPPDQSSLGEMGGSVETPSDEQASAESTGEGSESEVTAENSQTGADSQNSAESTSEEDTAVYGNNMADVDNDLVLQSDTGSNDSSKNTGDASVVTGDAQVVATVENQANQTGTVLGDCGDCGGGVSAENSQTGADSENSANSEVTDETLVVNNNAADLDNGVIAIADSGHNSVDKNTGNATVETGDADIGLTVVNMANTDITGVGTTEFDVYDDHRGDIVIDFSEVETNDGGGVSSGNEQTGAESTNNADVGSKTALTIVNNNDARVETELVADATTGRNTADKNTGDGTVTTGDANVVTNVVNLVNDTLVGGAEVLVATVNIFGDLVGDIVLAGLDGESCGLECGGGNLAAVNESTGAESENAATVNSNSNSEVYGNNTAEIGSSVAVVANTGDNDASENTGGGSVQTGDVNAQVGETTVANNNMAGGGTWWLVVVNEAGRWVGKIFGSEDGQNVASGGSVDLGVVNENTGAGSDNQASSSSESDSVVVTNNQAEVDSQVTVIADTGHNSASKNTGSGSIATGDVNLMANVVNFVNNNFVGGKVAITFVNVFGSWAGDIVPPGMSKPVVESDQPEVGGTESLSSSLSQSSNTENSSNGNDDTGGQEGGGVNGGGVNEDGNINNVPQESSTGLVASASVGGGNEEWGVNEVKDKLAENWTVDEDGYLKVPAVGQADSGDGDGGGWMSGLGNLLNAREAKMVGWLLLSAPLLLATRWLKRKIELSLELPAHGVGVGA
jgi:hypothetical protein